MASAKVMAVYVYADWCPNCKLISPVWEEVRTKSLLDKKDALFVTLDLTNKQKIHHSVLLAQALGLGDYLKAQGSGTGYIALIDPATKDEKARFTSTASSEDISKAIDALLTPPPAE